MKIINYVHARLVSRNPCILIKYFNEARDRNNINFRLKDIIKKIFVMVIVLIINKSTN